MGTYVSPNEFKNYLPNTYVFDLEYIGTSTKLEECHIWDIAVIHLLSGAVFEISIRPDVPTLPPPFSADFVTVTEDLLRQRCATTFQNAWTMLTRFVSNTKQNGGCAIFASHNCFKSDKIMLEIATKRHNIKMPYNWFFFDSLIYCRKQIAKQASYTLKDIHQTLFRRGIENQHFALADTVALRNILIRLNLQTLEGPVYPSYHTGLQAVKWLGPSSERLLFLKNIRSVEDLVQHLTIKYCDQHRCSTALPLRQFVESVFVNSYGIKAGNAASISASLVQNWILGV